MKNPKVMIVQKHVNKNSIADVERFLKIASANSCDFVLFPEYMDGKYDEETYDHKKKQEYKKSLQELAKRYKTFLVVTFLERIKGELFNVSSMIDTKGNIIGTHKKIALLKYDEAHFLKPGNKATVVPTPFGNAGIIICRDILYPEIAQELAKQDVKLIFCPSYWPYFSTTYMTNGPIMETYPPNSEHMTLRNLAITRAIETEAFMMVSNPVGVMSTHSPEEPHKDYLGGGSCISAPIHGLLSSMDHHSEGYIIQELDLDILEASKKTIAVQEYKPKLNHA